MGFWLHCEYLSAFLPTYGPLNMELRLTTVDQTSLLWELFVQFSPELGKCIEYMRELLNHL